MHSPSNEFVDDQMSGQRLFAAIKIGRDSDVERLFDEAIEILRRNGVKLAGYLQRDIPGDTGCCSILLLENIATGDRAKISQSLGKGSRGCRLDPSALAELSKNLASEIDDNTGMLILNRFGKGESDGQGLRVAIEKAIEFDIPVLTAVRDDYIGSWREFCGEFGVEISPTRKAVFSWCNNILGSRMS